MRLRKFKKLYYLKVKRLFMYVMTKKGSNFNLFEKCMCFMQYAHVFGDGTSDYCPKFFNELHIIHIYQNYFYVLVISMFIKSKSISTYNTIWI